MASRAEKLIAQASGYLREGELVHCALLASASALMNDHAVIVTSERIIIFEIDMFGKFEPNFRTVHRQTPLGPFRGWIWSESLRIPTQLYVSWAFKTEVAYADSFLHELPTPRDDLSPNKRARSLRRVSRFREASWWISEGDAGGLELVLPLTAFIFTAPWRLFRLARLALKTASQRGQKRLGRAIAALALNFTVWLGAIGLGWLVIYLFVLFCG